MTPTRRLKILVADDSPVNRRITSRMVESWSHTCVLVTNGREALDRLALESFDLVLMDAEMPVLDGLQAVALLRLREGQRRTPVIALSGHGEPAYLERFLAAGMDGWVGKPLEPPALFAAIERVMAA